MNLWYDGRRQHFFFWIVNWKFELRNESNRMHPWKQLLQNERVVRMTLHGVQNFVVCVCFFFLATVNQYGEICNDFTHFCIQRLRYFESDFVIVLPLKRFQRNQYFFFLFFQFKISVAIFWGMNIKMEIERIGLKL